jgi:uncharacterized damage-inducible protein DinB
MLLRMTPEYFQTLLDFNYWARDRALAAVEALTPEQYARPLGSSFSSIRDTLTHVYLSEWIWDRRLAGESPLARPTIDLPDVASLRARWSALEDEWRTRVAGLTTDRLKESTPYRLFNGQQGTSTVWEIVAHMVNHGSYHRGQVTTMLRQLGASPARSMDMITYFRERAA